MCFNHYSLTELKNMTLFSHHTLTQLQEMELFCIVLDSIFSLYLELLFCIGNQIIYEC